MSVTVTGILRDSGGNPAPNKIIKFYTTKGFDGALPSATLEITTSGTGQYNFELSTGIHILSVQYNDSLTKVSKVTVTSDMPSPQTLDSLLAFEEPLLPDEIIIVQGLVAEANAAAVRAETAASSVEGIEDEVEADRAEVEANAQQVATDAAQVAADTSTTQANADQVAADTVTVTDAQADVTTKTAQVSTDAAQVAEDALSVEENTLLSKEWAVGQSGSGSNVPSDTNNAYYYAMQALSNANQTFVSGGQWDPSVGDEYPNVSSVERDTIWIINLSGTTEYVFQTGALSGIPTNSGDMLFYDTPSDVFILIPTTIKSPDFIFRREEYTEIAGQSVLTVPNGYVASALDTVVLYNGTALSTNQYNITDDGATITLTDAVESDSDVITVSIWNKAEIATVVTAQIFSGTSAPEQAIGKDGDIYYQVV